MDRWQDWGEWYANVNRPGYRGLIAGRVLPRIMAAGYDGVFLDNVDMVESHPAQRSGMATLLSQVSRQVHARGRLVLAQNGDSQLAWMPLARRLEPRTSVSPTTSTPENIGAPPRTNAPALPAPSAGLRATPHCLHHRLPGQPCRPASVPQVSEAVRYSCRLGAKPYVGSIGLDRMPRRPLHC